MSANAHSFHFWQHLFTPVSALYRHEQLQALDQIELAKFEFILETCEGKAQTRNRDVDQHMSSAQFRSCTETETKALMSFV